MPQWQNWSGRRTAQINALHFVRSEEDAVGLVRKAAADKRSLRMVGSGHSHSMLVPTDGIIVDVSGLSGIVSVDESKQRAWLRAGTAIHALGAALHDHGLALQNQGDIDRQTIAGACATGTHGTGRKLGNFSSAVTGARIVLASGEVVTCNASENSDLWQSARLNLGAVGIVTQLEIQLTSSYAMADGGFEADFEEFEPRIAPLIESDQRSEFFWIPETDKMFVKVYKTDGVEPVYPIGREGGRAGWSYEVFPSHRPHRHTEMEYAVPLDRARACFVEIRELIQRDFPDVTMPIEYRTLAADDVWLSVANGRDTVTISAHQDIEKDDTAYFQACEKIFLAYEGRPHWGKVNYLDGAQLEACHANWHDWWRVRNEVDPGGVFLNDYLRSIMPK